MSVSSARDSVRNGGGPTLYGAPLRLATLAVGLALTVSIFARAQVEPPLVLTGGRLLAADGTTWQTGMTLRVEGDRIAAITEAAETELTLGCRHLDLAGLWVLPGLIDLHTHLALYPYDQRSWNDQVLKESLELRTIRGVTAAHATLDAGFTTIRDLGTEGAGFADVALRDAVAMGLIPGPRIFAVTRAIVATGCYGPSGFDPRWEMPVGAEVADGPDGVRRAVRRQIASGADWIKVYADYRRKPGDPSTPTFSQEELDAICDEARSAGVSVAAHASTDEAIRRAVDAGVRTIEHGYDVSTEVLAMMKQAGVALCPTLTASESMARYSGWTPGQPDHPRVVQAKAMFRRALDSGVTIACGSDVGVFAHGDQAREIELMVAYGMTPAGALRAATAVAADVLGRPDLGRLAVGAKADLIAVAGDPLADVSRLGRMALVVKDGRIAVDRRD